MHTNLDFPTLYLHDGHRTLGPQHAAEELSSHTMPVSCHSSEGPAQRTTGLAYRQDCKNGGPVAVGQAGVDDWQQKGEQRLGLSDCLPNLQACRICVK